jgi:hypothetical protein
MENLKELLEEFIDWAEIVEVWYVFFDDTEKAIEEFFRQRGGIAYS